MDINGPNRYKLQGNRTFRLQTILAPTRCGLDVSSQGPVSFFWKWPVGITE